MNHALREALRNKRYDDIDVASALSVDPKTVQRWISGRRPRQRYRWALADLLEVPEDQLWPDAGQARAGDSDDTVTVYAHRGAVPREVWLNHFKRATRGIDVLVYSGLFLVEDIGLLGVIAERGRAGVPVRLAFGNPESADVRARGAEEGIDDVLGAKVRSAFVLARPLLEVSGLEIRTHETVLYNSLYRADDEMLVNAHIYGVGAARAPVMHLRRTGPNSMVSTYLASFERVWADATPLS